MLFGKMKHKFRAKRVEVSGYSFASKLEAAVFSLLKLMEKAGEITDIKHQHTIYLTRAQISWRADFKVYDLVKNTEVLVEAKGFSERLWEMKLKLYRTYGPCPLWLFKGTYQKPKLVEEIFPTDWKGE